MSTRVKPMSSASVKTTGMARRTRTTTPSALASLRGPASPPPPRLVLASGGKSATLSARSVIPEHSTPSLTVNVVTPPHCLITLMFGPSLLMPRHTCHTRSCYDGGRSDLMGAK